MCCEWLFLRVLVLWETTFESGNGKKMRKWIMTSESVSVVREDFWECECCERRLLRVWVLWVKTWNCECCERTFFRVWVFWVMTIEWFWLWLKWWLFLTFLMKFIGIYKSCGGVFDLLIYHTKGVPTRLFNDVLRTN